MNDSRRLIQFRPGKQLGDQLALASRDWGVTANEAARRLVSLAASGLSSNDHDDVQHTAETTGASFTAAARTFSLLGALV